MREPFVAADGERGPGEHVQKSLALGFLAMLPLIVAYELATEELGTRNAAEALLSLPLAPLGDRVALARRIALGAFALFALLRTFAGSLGLVPRVARTLLEGALSAALFGPILVLLLALLGAEPPPLDPGPEVPSLAFAGLVCGGAAFEEIVFRVGAQGLAYLLAIRALRALGAAERWARIVSETLSIAVAGFVFAAAHLASFLSPLGAGGEPFDPHVFTWRALAGMLLSALFRWRGPGVAAWSHALFNLALLLGAGPDAFL
jgi:hypothetical protein